MPNEPEALVVQYSLSEDANGQAQITLADAAGRAVRQVAEPARAGLNRVLIPLAGGGGGGRGGGGGGGRGGAGRAGGPPAGPLAVGDYTITVEVGGDRQTVPARVRERVVRGDLARDASPPPRYSGIIDR